MHFKQKQDELAYILNFKIQQCKYFLIKEIWQCTLWQFGLQPLLKAGF